MLVLGTAVIVLGVSRWHAHTDYEALLRASQDTSEEKRLLDEQHTQARQQNQEQQQQLDTLRGQNVRLNAQVASLAERQREQDVQRSALENDKAELEKSVGMLRRHTLKLDEQLASKSQELQAIATQRETLSNALTLTEARVAGLAQSKSAVDAELQECRELHREALRGREAARADLAREHALAEQRKLAHDGFAGPAAASVSSKTP
jgi:chromosome segregation ATPase